MKVERIGVCLPSTLKICLSFLGRSIDRWLCNTSKRTFQTHLDRDRKPFPKFWHTSSSKSLGCCTWVSSLDSKYWENLCFWCDRNWCKLNLKPWIPKYGYSNHAGLVLQLRIKTEVLRSFSRIKDIGCFRSLKGSHWGLNDSNVSFMSCQ